MYNLVDESEVKVYRSQCSSILTEVRDILKEQYNIVTQFTLVGSGARNLVTVNGNGQYDLDYNLEILKLPDNMDLHRLKETIRKVLNQVVGGTFFTDGQDSTSVLTSNLYFKGEPNKRFSFDIAIVTKNSNGTLCRLIHNKNQHSFGKQGQYTWCEVPNSHNVLEKSKKIKNKNGWLKVRDRYVELKNLYLRRNDHNHPSFIVYVEAVNQVYNEIFGNGGRQK